MNRSEPKKLTFMKPKKIIPLINMSIETQTIMPSLFAFLRGAGRKN